MSAQVTEASEGRVIVTMPRPNDYTILDDELLMSLTPQDAEDLMHALEAWKDER